MYFLLEACEEPDVLRTLFFGTIIADLIFTIIPIALIAMLIVDFSKAVVSGNLESQAKSVKLIPKRIMYAVIIFAVPWIVSTIMNFLSFVGLNAGSDYNICIKRARSGDFSFYDKLLEDEEEAKKIGNGGDSGSSSTTYEYGSIDNIYQCDGFWANKKLVGKTDDGKQRTVCLSGCGFCSLTMVLRTLGYRDLTPDRVIDDIFELGGGKSGHAVPDDFVKIANSYGLNIDARGAVTSRDAAQALTPLLKEGKKIIINKPDHYISVLGINSDGTLIIGDSSHTSGFNKSGPYTMATLYDATTKTSPYYWLNVTIIWK